MPLAQTPELLLQLCVSFTQWVTTIDDDDDDDDDTTTERRR